MLPGLDCLTAHRLAHSYERNMFWWRPQQTTPKELGQLGEELACRFLMDQGYRILERNYRCPCGEIDIIAELHDTLRFIEVKTRSEAGEFAPEDAVDEEKRRHIRRVARHYLRGFRDPSPTFFDIVTLIIRPSGQVERLELRCDAFGWQE